MLRDAAIEAKLSCSLNLHHCGKCIFQGKNTAGWKSVVNPLFQVTIRKSSTVRSSSHNKPEVGHILETVLRYESIKHFASIGHQTYELISTNVNNTLTVEHLSIDSRLETSIFSSRRNLEKSILAWGEVRLICVLYLEVSYSDCPIM